MRRFLLQAWTLFFLVLVWTLLWGDISPANILGGVAVAVLIAVLLPLPVVPVQGRLHPLALLRLVLTVAWRLIKSSFGVAWLAIKPGPPPLSAVLRAYVDVKSDLVLALAVNIINLTPGTIVLEIDQSRRLLYVHVLDVATERAVNRFHREVHQVERLLISSFERPGEWQPSDRQNGMEAERT